MFKLNQRFRDLVLVAALALVAGACGGSDGQAADPSPSTTAPPATTPPTTAAPTTTIPAGLNLAAVAGDLKGELESWIAEYDVAGSVLAVAAPGQDILVIPVGVTDRDTGTSMPPDAYFRIGSVTKMTTATMLLQLQEEGLLDLDTPLVELLPSWADRGVEAGSTITPRMLLNHTSGIIAYENDPYISGLTLSRLNEVWDPDELIDLAVEVGLLFEPGTEFSYGTTTYLLAGQLVEEITGNPAHEELAARVLDPLGLENTFLPPVQQPPVPVVSGYYDLTGSGEETAKITALPQAAIQSLGWTGGGLESRASDVVKLLPGIIDGGLLTVKSLAEMTTPVPDTDYGLGVNVGDIAGQAAYFHGGGVPGFRTKHAYFPESGVAVALLSNSSAPDVDAMLERAAKLIFG